jgi:flagellum-specific peptidoglycan hydrolase FlgJ
MPDRIPVIFLAVIAILSVSCNSSKHLTSSTRRSSGNVSAVTTKNLSGPDLKNKNQNDLTVKSVVKPGTPEARYIDTYKDIAISEMKRTGVPASITLAQGMLESDFGRSRLSKEGNNHFGIKCHNGWDGATIYHDDDKKNDCFRRYTNPKESYSDHSDFLKSGSRYSFLFNLPPTDYKAWAYGLKKAGYATNPNYANLLIKKIEDYQLYAFDQALSAQKSKKNEDETKRNRSRTEKASKELKEPVKVSAMNMPDEASLLASADEGVIIARPERIKENNRIQYIIVKDGDTVEKLEKEFGLLKWELAKYNELEQGFRPEPGQILYLQPKRDKAEAGKDFYTASRGDTYYIISQKFGIKLKKLYEMNRVSEDAEPKSGDKIWLRSMKPVK